MAHPAADGPAPSPLTLASQSPRRRQLLDQVGADYRVLPVAVDETPAAEAAPAEEVVRFARDKAQAGAAASGDADRYLKANAAYHAAIYKVSGWPLLVGMIERLWLMVGPSIRMSVPDRAHMAISQGFHDQIMTALDARDGRSVRGAIVGDISTAAKDIRASLSPHAANQQRKEV